MRLNYWSIASSYDTARIFAEIAGLERAPFNEIVARYLKAVGDQREAVMDPGARYWGGQVEERLLVPLGEARLGRIDLDAWLHAHKKGPDPVSVNRRSAT